MLKELAATETMSPSQFLYDVVSHMHSAYAHGTSQALQQFRTLKQQRTFTCELGLNNGQSTLAIQGANTYLAWQLQGACSYRGLHEIDREIDDWFAKVRASHTFQPSSAA